MARNLARLVSLLPFLIGPSAAAQGPDYDLELFVGGLEQPTSMSPLHGDPTRFLVTQKTGKVRMVRNGILLPVPFLDLTARVDSQFEGGLLSVRTHPEYAQNGRLFVTYVTLERHILLQEYAVSSNPDLALDVPVQLIYEVDLPSIGAHYGGGLDFAPDGTLLLGLGDLAVMDAAQEPGDPRGKLMRFDVDLPAPFVPADNPFVGMPGFLPEIYALGLRNPWSFRHDPATADLWIGDVGWGAREEVDLVPAGSGGGQNFGWPCFQGNACAGGSCDCLNPIYVDPVIDYIHNFDADVNCVIAGGIYHGSAIPDLVGRFVHADCLTGAFWSFRMGPNGPEDVVKRTFAPLIERTSSFGIDLDGEFYILSLGIGAPTDGSIFKVVPGCSTENYCTALPNSTGAPGLITSSGSTSVSQADLTLEASSLVPGGFVLFHYGAETAQIPLGDGFRCVDAGGLQVFRLRPPAAVQPGGDAVHGVDFGSWPVSHGPGEIVPGSTWYFQGWYRDFAGVSGFNLTDGLRVTFCP